MKFQKIKKFWDVEIIGNRRKRYYITYKMFRKSDGLENQMRINSSEVFVIAR